MADVLVVTGIGGIGQAIVQAVRYIAAGHTRGKVVISIASPEAEAI
jgi:hypothetical protein